jgi:hypothetical protein
MLHYLSKNERRKKTYYRDVRNLICKTLSISDREFERSQPAWKKFLRTLEDAEKFVNICNQPEGNLPTLFKITRDVKVKPLYRAMAMAIQLSPEKYPSLFSWSATKDEEIKLNVCGTDEMSYFGLEWQKNKDEDLRLIRFSHLLLERNIREAKSLDVSEMRDPQLTHRYNFAIQYALRILPEDDTLAKKLFDHYSWDFEYDSKTEKRMRNTSNDGYQPFLNFLMYEPMPAKWKYAADKKMRAIILAEQKMGAREPCRSLLAYSKHVKEFFSFFVREQKRLKETGMFTPTHAAQSSYIAPLFASQMEFLLGFSDVEQKLRCVYPLRVPEMFQILSGGEYKELRWKIARHVVFLGREHPWAFWSLFNRNSLGVREICEMFIGEFSEDTELVMKMKKDMEEAEGLHEHKLMETKKLKDKLREAFDCLK